jgi:aspartokinase-like uncharacterized kinase
VAKLGGSLWAAPALRSWLAALLRFPHRLTIAPGGGPFADAVRRAQGTMGFSDRAAHRMALLAMEQYALALVDLEPRLTAAATLSEAAAAHRRGAAALWRPVAMTHADPHIPQSWDITSDSLAAWYAREAGADALLLIKSVDVSREEDVVARGVVDPLLPHYASGLRAFIAGPSALGEAGDMLRFGTIPGVELEFLDSTRKQSIAS